MIIVAIFYSVGPQYFFAGLVSLKVHFLPQMCCVFLCPMRKVYPDQNHCPLNVCDDFPYGIFGLVSQNHSRIPECGCVPEIVAMMRMLVQATRTQTLTPL